MSNPLVDPLVSESIMSQEAEVKHSNTETKSVVKKQNSSDYAIRKPSGSTRSAITKAIGGLAFVLIIITVIAYFAKRMGITGLSQGRGMKLRESLSIGAKERLVIVDYAGERLILGVSPGQVNLLKIMEAVDASDEPGDPQLAARNPLDFQQKLNHFLMKGQR